MTETSRRSRLWTAHALSGGALALVLSGCATGPRRTPLQQAACDGDVARARRLVSGGANPGEIGPNGADSIAMAVDSHPDLARLLLEKCVAEEAPAEKCPHALQEAATLGNMKMARILAAKGADADAAIVDVKRSLSDRADAMRRIDEMSGFMGGAMGDAVAAARRGIERDNAALALLIRLRNEPQAASEAATKAVPPAEKEAVTPWWKTP